MLTLLTFSDDYLEVFSSDDLDVVLQKIDRTRNTLLRHVAGSDRTTIQRIIEHFELKRDRVDLVVKHASVGVNADLEDCLFNTFEVLTVQPDTQYWQIYRGTYALGHNFALTFEPQELEPLSTLISNVQKQTVDIQKGGVDYLLYLLFKGMLANYQLIFSEISRRLDVIEDHIADGVRAESIYQQLNGLKQALRMGRTNFQNIKAIAATANSENTQWFSPNVVRLFNRELLPQVENLLQDYQAARNWMAELMETQRDTIANQTNERINRLTTLSFIFLPISFITSVYGMNFKYMPEIYNPWAYPIVLAVMALIALGSILFARRNQWL